MHTETAIILAGPTASGKTDIAIQLAQHCNTNIISADARQCYIELNIGVAKPTAEQLKIVPHYFINTYHIYETVNAAIFEQYALQKAEQFFQHNKYIIITGGTGLYIKAFCEGLDNIPTIPNNIQTTIRKTYEQKGIAWLQKELTEKDSTFAQQDDMQNPQRMLRALEVLTHTGKSIRTFQTGKKQERFFRIIKFGLDWPREELYNRINKRVDMMIEKGLIEEVKSLLPYKNLPALQTVGYTELFEYFERKISLDKAIELIKQNTRHYAKRQLTWFKKDPSIQWVKANDWEKVHQLFC